MAAASGSSGGGGGGGGNSALGGAALGMQLGAAIGSAYAAYSSARSSQKISAFNAKVGEMQAKWAEERGLRRFIGTGCECVGSAAVSVRRLLAKMWWSTKALRWKPRRKLPSGLRSMR